MWRVNMANLLKETMEILEENGRKEKDVLYCCGNSFKFTWDNFKELADVEYDDGYGGEEVATNLKVVGKDFWLERHNYDGSEWWEFKELPNDNLKLKVIDALTVDQATAFNRDVYSCSSLERMNNIV
jgi:hypothetical protein